MPEKKTIVTEDEYYDMLADQYDAMLTVYSDAMDHSYDMMDGGL